MTAPPRKLLHFALATLALAAARFVSGRWLQIDGIVPVSVVTGLALAWMLLRGRSLALAVIPATALAALALGGSTATSWFAGLATATGLAITHTLLIGPLRFDPCMSRPRDAAMLAFGALLGTMAGGALMLPLTRVFDALAGVAPPQAWLRLWLGQAIGILTFTPLVLVWARDRGGIRGPAGTAESVSCAVLALAAATIVFGTDSFHGARFALFTLVVLPLCAWLGIRGDRRVAHALLAAVVTIAAVGTARGLGLFASLTGPARMRNMQDTSGIITLVGALIAANETGRRSMMDTLRSQEARLRRVIEGSNDGFWEWHVPSGSVTWSPRAAAILGFEPEVFRPNRAQFARRLHPRDFSRMRRFAERHLAGSDDPHAFEFRARHRDGHWVWLLARGRVYERDPAGTPLRASGTISDVTERKRAEIALRRSQHMFESFMRHSPAVSFIRDSEGRMRWGNETFARTVLESPDTPWLHRTIEELFPPAAWKSLRDSDRRVLETGSAVVVEQPLTVGGRDRLWLTVKFPILGDSGEVLIGGMGMDITDRRRAEEQQRGMESRMTEAQKLESLGLLAGGVAHDFNNILTSILGHADLVREQVPAGSRAHEHVEQILRGAHSAAELTRQMLAYAGRGSVVPAPLSLGDLVREMGQLLQVSISKRIAIQYDIPVGLPAIQGDEAQMRQVVMNLIVNAAEATGARSGVIRLRLSSRECSAEDLASRWAESDGAPGPHVVLEVIDQGCGMDDDTVARMFDPFFSTKFTGRGLGLAAVLGIVRAHHARIQVESRPNQGTTFRILFPALAASAPTSGTPREPEPWRGHGAALVVDDEDAVRDLAMAMLRRLGFDPVIGARGGAEGIARFRERAGEIRVVLLDLTMPDVDGPAVRREIVAMRPDACIVFTSGYGEVGEADLDAGAGVPFMSKPYRLQDLAVVMRAALERAGA